MIAYYEVTARTVEPILSFMAALSVIDEKRGLSVHPRESRMGNTYRSTKTGSLGVEFNLNTRALVASLSCVRTTIEPSVCLFGRLVRDLSITSCQDIVIHNVNTWGWLGKAEKHAR